MRSVSPISETPARISPSKRKRSISDPSLHIFAPRVRTENPGGAVYSEAQLEGAQSPRSFVAERLGELKLHHFRGRAEGVNGDKAGKYKRVRVATRTENGIEEEHGTQSGESLKPQIGQPRLKSPPPAGYRSAGAEIEETPQALGASTPSISSQSSGSSMSPAPRRISNTAISPPMERSSSLPAAPTKSQSQIHFDSPTFRSSTSEAQPKTLKSLETTDHEPDEEVLDPDDDGTGINGIGFKPTPAMAWQRTQKRKQQIQEWRAREAREARQKRSERRNRAAIAMGAADPGDEAELRRTVRFA